MLKITLSTQALEDMVYLARSKPKLLSKIANLLESISKSPFDGIGKPEPLKYDFEGCWSRRIDLEHRLIYFVKDETIQVLSFRGHYE